MFQRCFYLENVIIGESVKTIEQRAFRSCSSLNYIYYYSEASPIVLSNSFSYVPASSVILFATYQGETFGELNISKEITIEGCLPMPAITFTESSTFSQSKAFSESNTFTQSNIFIKSNTTTESSSFTESSAFNASLQSDASFTNIITLTHSLLLTQFDAF